MRVTTEYTCKFCKQTRVFDGEIEDCPKLEMEKWRSMLVCDRCADYERERRDCEERIRRQAIAVKTIRMQFSEGHTKLQELEDKCRKNLNFLTKKFGEIVCRRSGKVFQWEPDVPDYILRKPDEWHKIISVYRRAIEGHYANRS